MTVPVFQQFCPIFDFFGRSQFVHIVNCWQWLCPQQLKTLSYLRQRLQLWQDSALLIWQWGDQLHECSSLPLIGVFTGDLTCLTCRWKNTQPQLNSIGIRYIHPSFSPAIFHQEAIVFANRSFQQQWRVFSFVLALILVWLAGYETSRPYDVSLWILKSHLLQLT